MEEALIPYIFDKTISLFNDTLESKFLLAILAGIIFSDLLNQNFFPIRKDVGKFSYLFLNYGIRYLLYITVTLVIIFVIVLALNALIWLVS